MCLMKFPSEKYIGVEGPKDVLSKDLGRLLDTCIGAYCKSTSLALLWKLDTENGGW
jgi:hypothetical protein